MRLLASVFLNFRCLCCVTALLLTSQVTSVTAADTDIFTRREDVIYGRKFGTALTLDVFTPKEKPNGAAVIAVVSGGWFSDHGGVNPGSYLPFLKRGYTVIAVVHGSQPKFTIPEVLTDMHRAVRFIRSRAEEFHIDPKRIGITGGSAGGHLSLMIGTSGTDGDPNAKDPIDRQSSRVQAVGCFYPPTDFLNWGEPGINALGKGPLGWLPSPFDFREFDGTAKKFISVTDEEKLLKIGREISPITHVSADDPPTLIIHGDADKVVPIQQAQIMVEKLKSVNVPNELINRPGQGHGWPTLQNDVELFADWFDKHLANGNTK